jgi:hypothetical protein
MRRLNLCFRVVACLSVVLVGLVSSPAHALDAAIERGRALLAAGDVAGALGVVGEAEARSDLPSGDLLALLALRGTAEAMSEDALALARTARAIVELAPAWHAPEGAPEAFRAALDEARIAQPEPPELDVDVYPAQGSRARRSSTTSRRSGRAGSSSRGRAARARRCGRASRGATRMRRAGSER